VRAEAEQRRLEELARVQAEAAALRAKEIEAARAAAEAEAREALAAELARVRAEAENEIARAQGEAEQTFTQELAQVRAQAERALASELTRARADDEEARQAELARALEEEIARVRADAEARLQAELDRVRREAEDARLADQAELDRIRREADERLKLEVAALEAEAERKRQAELEAVRAEVDAMREAAAQQARNAAAEAVAAELARARSAGASGRSIALPRPPQSVERDPTSSGTSSYYDLWRQEQPDAAAAPAAGDQRKKKKRKPTLPRLPKIDRQTAVRIAAGLVLVVGVAVSAETRWWTVVADRVRAAATPGKASPGAPPAEVAKPRDTGDLIVETTPPGARVLLDGTPRGETPLTLTDLKPGRHKLVLESTAGTVRRDVVIRAGERTVADEAIIPGFLAVNSRIPVEVLLGNRRLGSSEDGQLLLPPGRHKVTLRNDQFNFVASTTVEIEAGRVRAHNVTLPMGRVDIDAPAGAEVWIEGQRIGEGPLQDVPVPIGTREILVRHPEFGERREVVEVRQHRTNVVQPRTVVPGPAGGPPRLLPLSRPKVKVGTGT